VAAPETERPPLRVRDRIVPADAYRPSAFAGSEPAARWWTALGAAGALLAVLAAFVVSDWGTAAAIGGTTLFLAAAVTAGLERAALTTALGAAGVVWVTVGVALVQGGPTDLGAAAGVAAAIGLGLLGTGLLGRLRSPDR